MIDFLEPIVVNLKKESEEKLSSVFSTLIEFKSILDNDPVFSKLSLEPIVAGGAIRDIVNNKPQLVKDIDIFLSFESLSLDSSNMLRFMEDCYKHNYVDNHHKYLPIEEQMINSQFILKALSYVINNHYQNIKEIHSNNFTSENNEDYQDIGINGVIKIEDNNLNYPVDLIINFINPHSTVTMFDFDLCKTYITSEYDKDMSLLSNAVLNLKLTAEFKKDIQNKTISMNCHQFAEIAVIRSINSHLPRLMDKYSEHTLNLTNLDSCPQAQIVLEKLILDRALGQNKTISSTKKIKI